MLCGRKEVNNDTNSINMKKNIIIVPTMSMLLQEFSIISPNDRELLLETKHLLASFFILNLR